MRLSADERSQLEQAAAASGYRHLGTYVRDRALGRSAHPRRSDQLDRWVDQQMAADRLADIARAQSTSLAVLASLLLLELQRSQAGHVSAVRAALSTGKSLETLIATLLPEVLPLADQLMES